jgi:mannosyltransferase
VGGGRCVTDGGGDTETGRHPLRERVRRLTPAWVPIGPGALAFTVTSIGLGRRQLWRDELATLTAARLPVRDLFGQWGRTDPVHVPYYLFMHGWVRLFGASEVALRMPSALAVGVAAALIAVLGQLLYRPAVGVLAGVLFALLPAVSRYGQEARPYGLVFVAVVGATLLLVLGDRRPTWPVWSGYAGTLTVLGYLQLVGLTVLLPHAVYLALRAREGAGWRPFVRWSVATGAALVAVLPLLWLGLGERPAAAWIVPLPGDYAGQFFVGLPGSVEVGGVLLGLAVLGCRPGGSRTALLATWALGPLLLLWAATPLIALLTPRYVLFVLPAWCLLAAAAVVQVAPATAARAVPRVATATVLGLVVLLGLSQQFAVRGPVTLAEPDIRSAAGVVAAHARPGDLLAFTGPYPWWASTAMNYYLPPHPHLATSFQAVPDQPTPTYDPHCRTEDACLRGGGRIWLVNTEPGSSVLSSYAGLGTAVEATLRSRFVVTTVDRFSGVSVSLLTPRPAPG